ncbi:MAG: hypothetical protein ACI4SB_06805 [Acutalibacteraceae bacterium]
MKNRQKNKLSLSRSLAYVLAVLTVLTAVPFAGFATQTDTDDTVNCINVLYDFEYTTDRAEAEANPDLEWIPSYNMPRFDRTIGTTSVYQAGQFYEQGYPFYCWPNANITDQESMKATVVSKEDGAPVLFGEHSLMIEFNYETYTGASNCNNYLRVTCPDHAFEGSPTALGCWVYIPEGTADFVLYLNCSNKDWDFSYQTIGDCNWTGWKYCEFDLTNPSNYGSGSAKAPFGFYQGCGVFWISYQPGGQKGDKNPSKVYLDNIQLRYGSENNDPSAISHNPAEAVRENEKAATCSENGSYDSVVYCMDCYAELSRETVITDKISHTESEWIIDKAPDCVTDGAKHTECTVCGQTLQTAQIPAKGHHFVQKTVEPDCETDGSVMNVCTVCAAEEFAEVLPATGHTDADNDGKCDICAKVICTHICHRKDILGLIWSVFNAVFLKLFGIKTVCPCGVAHY